MDVNSLWTHPEVGEFVGTQLDDIESYAIGQSLVFVEIFSWCIFWFWSHLFLGSIGFKIGSLSICPNCMPLRVDWIDWFDSPTNSLTKFISLRESKMRRGVLIGRQRNMNLWSMKLLKIDLQRKHLGWGIFASFSVLSRVCKFQLVKSFVFATFRLANIHMVGWMPTNCSVRSDLGD